MQFKVPVLVFACVTRGFNIGLHYRGFSPALAGLKQELNSKNPELPRENPGSKWPKTSFGALKDNQRLTPEHLSVLLKLCRIFNESLQTEAKKLLVDHLLIVIYKCRSLEKYLELLKVPLSSEDQLDDSMPSQQEQDNVQAVLQEADHPSYWVSASRDGNRESHYRGPALGCTLVASLGGQTTFTNKTLDHNKGTQLTEVINQFRQQVDQSLPGMYAWFDDGSLHVTIRALMG
ncbi:hypothetical protein WJX77_004302 [Trebouxia sp. C0004]